MPAPPGSPPTSTTPPVALILFPLTAAPLTVIVPPGPRMNGLLQSANRAAAYGAAGQAVFGAFLAVCQDAVIRVVRSLDDGGAGDAERPVWLRWGG